MHRRIFVCLMFAAPAFAQMNMSMNDTGMYLMNLASGTSQNPESAPMPMIMTHLGSWQTMLMGQGFINDVQADRPARRGTNSTPPIIHGDGAAFGRRARDIRSRTDAQPGTRHHHRRAVSGAVSDRRNRLRPSHHRRAASAQFHHGAGVSLHPPACRENATRPVLRAGGRSGAGASRISASRFGF